VLTTAQARKKAQDALARMANGENPNKTKNGARARAITLAAALELYLASPKPRSQQTLNSYRYVTEKYLGDWLARSLKDIARDEACTRHKRLGNESGKYTANFVFRVFRAVYNRALKQHADLPGNPTIAVDFYPEEPRKAAIPFDQLPAWYQEVMAMDNPVRRAYLLFVLFTGLRRESAAVVRWKDVNLKEGTLFIPNPKGGKKRAFKLPLSEYLVNILKERKKENEILFPGSPYVFPSWGKKGYITEPREKFKIVFSIHGLRHTYISAAQAAGVPLYDIKLLTNHALPKGDVTAGYITPSLDALGKQQVCISKYLLELIK
jgi:integrase